MKTALARIDCARKGVVAMHSPSVVIFALVLCRVACFACEFPEREPNNTFPVGPPLGTLHSGCRIVGQIFPAGDVDYHTFYTRGTGQPGWYRFVFATENIPAGGDSVLTLFDGINEQFTLSLSDDFIPGQDLTSRCTFDMYWDGNDILWGLRIEGFETTDVWPYAIRVTYEPISVQSMPTMLPGHFVFDTSGHGTIQDTVLSLFDSQGGFIAWDDDSGEDFRAKLAITLPAGVYFLAISTFETQIPVPGQPRVGLGPGTYEHGTYVLKVRDMQFSGSIARGTAEWYRVTVGTVPKTVSGRVLMDQFIGDPRMWPVTFDLREPGTLNVLETHVVPLDIDGYYSFETSLRRVVDVAAKSAQWLRTIQSLDLTGDTTNFNWFLPGGDANGDNRVDLFDLNLTLVNFAQEGPYTPGDVDGNSLVDLRDVNLVLLRFATRGAD